MRVKSYRKHVACLEGLWDLNVARPLTVRHILQTGADVAGFRFAHLTCNTGAEFDYNLRLLRGLRGFGVLYLAFHGSPGRIELPTETLELEELARRMGRGFKGWIVHLGACATVRVPAPRLEAFVQSTGVAMVLGYRKNVDWLESAGAELLLLDRLQRYVDLGSMWSGFQKDHPGLVERTGLSVYPT
jgi:hypothetical protein